MTSFDSVDIMQFLLLCYANTNSNANSMVMLTPFCMLAYWMCNIFCITALGCVLCHHKILWCVCVWERVRKTLEGKELYFKQPYAPGKLYSRITNIFMFFFHHKFFFLEVNSTWTKSSPTKRRREVELFHHCNSDTFMSRKTDHVSKTDQNTLTLF